MHKSVKYIYINLGRSRYGTLFDCSAVRVFVFIRSSLHSVRFGHLLRCAHKRIVNIMKVCIERKNMQVQLIPFRKNIDFFDVENLEAGNFIQRRVYEIGLIAIRDVSPRYCLAMEYYCESLEMDA